MRLARLHHGSRALDDHAPAAVVVPAVHLEGDLLVDDELDELRALGRAEDQALTVDHEVEGEDLGHALDRCREPADVLAGKQIPAAALFEDGHRVRGFGHGTFKHAPTLKV